MAEQECPFLWATPCVEGDNKAMLEGTKAKMALLRSFQSKAALFKELHLVGTEQAFTALLPTLLRAIAGARSHFAHAPFKHPICDEAALQHVAW